ncbi:tellurite resistance TerB family protein [Mesorhizobium sp. M0227]
MGVPNFEVRFEEKKLPTPHEALIYLMVITSASDRDMTDVELARIGEVVRSWPVFEDFNHDRLVGVAQDCQKRLHEKDGLEGVLAEVAEVLPERLRDTAYAAAFEVAAVDLEMRMEEVRVLQLIRRQLDLDTLTVAAIGRAAKARLRTLT